MSLSEDEKPNNQGNQSSETAKPQQPNNSEPPVANQTVLIKMLTDKDVQFTVEKREIPGRSKDKR